MNNADIAELLKGIELFSNLTESQLEQLISLVEPKSFCREETIILEKDESVQALYLIASGEVKVYMTDSDGKETILSLLGRGDFFGEMSLIDGEPRSASVKAVTAASLLVIRREHFLELLRSTPELSISLLIEMCVRLRKANRHIGSLSTMSVYGRVAGTIMNLIQEKGVRVHDGQVENMVTVIRNRPTQQQLAEMAGTTRETVSRIFSSLVKKGFISVAGKDLIIYDENFLEERELKE